MTNSAQRGAHPASIDYQTNRPWRVLLPPVFRYLPRMYVERFFESGELRLSSFSQFSKHKDEARGDREEGNSLVSSKGGGRQFLAAVGGGHKSYVLCGSFTLSGAIMSKFSGCDAAFEITDVPNFAFAVARQLAGFTSGISGYCIYADSRMLIRNIDNDPFPLPANPGEGIPMETIFQATAAAGQGEDLFLKQSKYAYQAEYRLIWHLDKPPHDSLIVVAPDARQFCRQVTSDELL